MRVIGIITCHNYGDLVGGAIDSFYAQGYEAKSLIVIDDGSSDNSWDVIEEKTRGKPPCPVEIFRIDEPQGQSYAKNFAVQHGWDRADAFAFLDADDQYLPGKLATASLLSEKVGVVYTDAEVAEHPLHDGPRVPIYRPPYSLDALATANTVGGNFIVSKAALADAGHFDEQFKVAEDYDFLLRVARKRAMVHVPELLVRFHLTNRCLRKRVATEEWQSYERAAITRAQ